MISRLFALLILSGFLAAQTPTPVSVPPAPAPVIPVPTWLPKEVDSAGVGFSSPSSKFAFVSRSTYLGQATYWTIAIEDTFNHKNVTTCTLTGVTKLLYQYRWFTVGATGLGGGCTSTDGTTSAAAAGQPFVDVRWGKTAFGNTITATKQTAGGWKLTLDFRRAQ
jgi:hypothetical protein